MMEGGSPFYGYEGCPSSPCASEFQLLLNDTYGDGWNGNRMTVFDCDHNPLAVDITLPAGRRAQTDICLPPNHANGFVVHVGGGTWQEEITWELTDAGRPIISGHAPFYGSINCSNVECAPGEYSVVLESRVPSGWHGASLTYSQCNGTVLASDITLQSNSFARVCLPPVDGYKVSVTAGEWPIVVVWTLFDDEGTRMLSGGADTDVAFGCPPEPCHDNDWNITVTNLNGHRAYLSISNCSHDAVMPDVILWPGLNTTLDLCLPPEDGYYVVVGGGELGESDS
jgi:hypothetical protein